MYEIIRILASESESITADKLAIGDLAEAVGRGFDDVVVLKTYSGLVDLSDPKCTWSGSYPLRVKKLPQGTVLQLRVRD